MKIFGQKILIDFIVLIGLCQLATNYNWSSQILLHLHVNFIILSSQPFNISILTASNWFHFDIRFYYEVLFYIFFVYIIYHK